MQQRPCVLSSEIRRKPKKTKHFARIFATLSGDFYRYPVVFNLEENGTTLFPFFQGNLARSAGILPTQNVSTKRPNVYLRRIKTQWAMHDKSVYRYPGMGRHVPMPDVANSQGLQL